MATEIRYTAPWKLALGFVVWALLIGGFGFLSIDHLYEDYCFSHHAVPTTGKVVQKYITSHHDRHGTSYTYHVSYNYMAEGASGFCQQTVLSRTYYYLQEGGPVPVMYLPDRPMKVRVNLLNEERQLHLETGILCAVTAFFLLVGGFMLFNLSLANSRYQQLLREGQLCRATVMDVGCDYVGRARTPNFYLKLLYRDMMGSELSGRSIYLPSAQEGRWREGDSLDLRYDRARPKRFTIDLDSGRRDKPDAAGNPSNQA